MSLFRMFLVMAFAVIFIYTGIVMQNHGANLLAVFIGDMVAMTWAGQFNLDFMIMLALSGLWTLWRNQFTASAAVLGLCAFLGGALFLTLYLLYLLKQSNGDIKMVLIGNR